MKSAICFYGGIGSRSSKLGTGKSLDPALTHLFLKKHILDVNDNLDIFIHSWSTEVEKELISLYSPKKYIIEECFFFSKKDSTIEKTISDLQSTEEVGKRTFSRFYSSAQVINLKQEYEQEKGFIYDYVLITRLDVCFFTDFVFTEYDNNFFYAGHWNQVPMAKNGYIAKKEPKTITDNGILDLWFFSNSKNIDLFGKLYDNVKDYYNDSSPDAHSIIYNYYVLKYIGLEHTKFIFYDWFDFAMTRLYFYALEERIYLNIAENFKKLNNNIIELKKERNTLKKLTSVRGFLKF